jgi:tetratricopeptide (TPR) repeat protein
LGGAMSIVDEKLKEAWEWLSRHFGVAGTLVGALLLGALFSWYHWDTVRILPGIDVVIEYIVREPLPVFREDTFSVVVANLENDAQNEEGTVNVCSSVNDKINASIGDLEHKISVERLNRKIKGIHKGSTSSLKEARKEVQNYILKTNAKILIWGYIHHHNGQQSFELYIENRDGEGNNGRHDYAYQENSRYTIENKLYSDLMDVLAMNVISRYSIFSETHGYYQPDIPKPYMEAVRKLLKNPWMSDERREEVRGHLADALSVLGEQTGQSALLVEAIQLYRENLGQVMRKKDALRWGMTQNSLGVALQAIGEREKGTEYLDEAVAAYREALREYTQQLTPRKWAMIQINLASALSSLGARESGTAHLEEAVSIYRTVLLQLEQKREELLWVSAKNNLGSALKYLGERESGVEYLKEAIIIFNDVLNEQNCKQNPFDCAMTQYNLGTVLYELDGKEPNVKYLEEAAGAFYKAINMYTLEKMPINLAMTQNNLGNILQKLGYLGGVIDRLDSALAFHSSAWEIFLDHNVNYYVEISFYALLSDLRVLTTFPPADAKILLAKYQNDLFRMRDWAKSQQLDFPEELLSPPTP